MLHFVFFCLYYSSSTTPATIIASFAGCMLVKRLNKLTYDELHVSQPGDMGRSMVTGDMIKNIGRAFHAMLT